MTQKTKELLQNLAAKYETVDFMKDDPSRFMHIYTQDAQKKQKELVCFIASSLSFGSRVQFCKKIQSILNNMATCTDAPLLPCDWVLQKRYLEFFSNDTTSFYRMYSNKDMIDFFEKLCYILQEYNSLEQRIKTLWQTNNFSYLVDTFCVALPDCRLVPSTKSSAKKRLCMFLRWMVRKNSPVDLGLWGWHNQKDLIIPLDTHVMQQAQKLGLTKRHTADFKTALEITNELKQVWPCDPTKGDFALFGLGVTSHT